MRISTVVLTPLNTPLLAAPIYHVANFWSNVRASSARCQFGAVSCVSFPSESCFGNSSSVNKCKLFEQRSGVKMLSPSRCHVQSEGQEGTVSGESILADQQALELELQIAIEEENYTLAAKIRDSLKNLYEDSKGLVLAANARFYNSFRTGDLAGMQALWAQGDHVCCVHPGVPVISGYDLVIQSWEYVLADYEFPLKIELKDVLVHVRGDLGYVTCVEFIKTTGSSWGRQTATNVFERINGQWFICIHHATRIVT